MEIAEQIGKHKKAKGIAVRNLGREEEVISRLSGTYPELSGCIKPIYAALFDASSELQEQLCEPQ